MISWSGHVSHSWETRLKSSCRMSETALKADADGFRGNKTVGGR